ncbi:hypothetical protein [Nevskia soli]|uniref:hypothetical protein n=1 Tax=Nevskia soli TaxID=418856 RepID=UPI0004A72D3E|nr:hypothetical protein [Nevskia soli]
MRTRLATLLLLTGLALQPVMAGGWGHEQRREPPRPPQQQQRMPPQQQQYRPPEPPRQQMFPPPQQRPQGPGVSRGEAMRRAQQMNGGGRVLAADPAESGYRVRVLKDGEVRSVYIPGQ